MVVEVVVEVEEVATEVGTEEEEEVVVAAVAVAGLLHADHTAHALGRTHHVSRWC